MGSAELNALPAVCGLATEQLTSPVAGMHAVISERVFRYLGPGGRLVESIHDTVAGGVYRAIPRAAPALGAVIGAIWGARSRAADPVSGTDAAPWQAALNAIWGDRLADHRSPLAIDTSFRSDRHRRSPRDVAAQLGGNRSHVVVLLHGLGQTESCWLSPGGLGSRLSDDRELVPVFVRYNSGRPVAEIGVEVAALLDELWSVSGGTGITLSLVGFSLGGVVARSAFATMVGNGSGSGGAVRHIITIGAPHTGSHVARAAGLATAGLGVAKTTRPLAQFLDGRSVSIKQLEWSTGLDRLPYSPSVRHHFAAATVTADPRHPIGVLVGDLVVGVGSATAPAVGGDRVTVLGKRRHLDLLRDADVQLKLIEWLRGD